MPVKKPNVNILLFSRRTIYDTALEQKRDGRLRRLILKNHKSVRRIKLADHEHKKTLDDLVKLLDRFGFAYRLVYDFKRVNPDRFDFVMTVGGDGTVLYASHHLGSTALLGINSSPSTSAGHLTSACRKNLKKKLQRLRSGRMKKYTLHRLAVTMDDVLVHDRVLNDVLFISSCPAVTTRYFLRVRGVDEEQMSSGIWIGPAAGSTAALLSAGGRVLPPRSKKIQFVVREPRACKGGKCRLRKGIVGPDEKIIIVNKWQKSEMFIDGPHKRVAVQPGRKITVQSSRSPLVLLGWKE